MDSVSITGSDTLILNNAVVDDLADGDAGVLSFPNDIAAVKVGKNGNAIFALNASGKQGDLVMRVLVGSADDKKFNNLYLQQQSNFPGFPLLSGEFIKKVGDGQGNITNVKYLLGSGVFKKAIEAKTNVEGDTEQSIAIYNLSFAKVVRVLT